MVKHSGQRVADIRVSTLDQNPARELEAVVAMMIVTSSLPTPRASSPVRSTDVDRRIFGQDTDGGQVWSTTRAAARVSLNGEHSTQTRSAGSRISTPDARKHRATAKDHEPSSDSRDERWQKHADPLSTTAPPSRRSRSRSVVERLGCTGSLAATTSGQNFGRFCRLPVVPGNDLFARTMPRRIAIFTRVGAPRGRRNSIGLL